MSAMKSLTLLVLAAGLGSRYGGLKQIDPVGPQGEAILDYSIYDAHRAGFSRVVFIIRKDIEQAFKQTVGARFENRIAVDYVFQELDLLPPGFAVPRGRSKPWGTTHAVLMAADAIHEPFAVINADDFYGAEGYRALAQHLQSGTSDYAMVGFVLRNTLSEFGAVSRGVCQVDGDGILQNVVEMTSIARDGEGATDTDAAGKLTRLTGDELVSMNMWGFTPQVFAPLRKYFQSFLAEKGSDARSECYLPCAVNQLVVEAQARVRVLRTMDGWFGVTNREDRPRVVESIGRLIHDGIYPNRLWT
jgi:NDP-sugar pyrophosphorylase family protein